MRDKINKLAEKVIEQINDANADMIDHTFERAIHGFEEIMKTFGLNNYFINRIFDGGIIPAIHSFLQLEKEITDPLIAVMYGEKNFFETMQEIWAKFTAGSKYNHLVKTFGKELFSSAKWDGEKKLYENDYLTLTYIPSKKGVTQQKAALFHVGCFLPYSDKIFRLLQECNLYDRFLEKGIPVYAVELKGDKDHIGDIGKFTLAGFIDMLDEMSNIAFKHNKNQKMLIEGYCGLAMPTLSFLAAKPKIADQRFKVAFTMVAPVDGKKCKMLGHVLTVMPQHMLATHFTITDLLGGFVRGSNLRAGMDIPLRGFFPKTSFGRFVTGWKNQQYANVEKIEDLTPGQRRDLAGAYWISPQNCDRFPMPLDLVKFSTNLFLHGIKEDGKIPYVYKGKQLNFNAIKNETKIDVVGFYGQKDKLVPNETGLILKKLLGSRYHHVVHPTAGHISYVLSPKQWDLKHPKALHPNPVDKVMGLYKKP